MLALLGFAGSGLQAYGQIRQSEAQADSALANSAMKYEQAEEMMFRSLINQDAIRRQSVGKQASVKSAYAASGVRLDAGSPLDVLETIALEYDREIANKYIEDSFRAKQLRKEGDSYADAAGDITEAGYISGFSTILSGGAKYFGGT